MFLKDFTFTECVPMPSAMFPEGSFLLLLIPYSLPWAYFQSSFLLSHALWSMTGAVNTWNELIPQSSSLAPILGSLSWMFGLWELSSSPPCLQGGWVTFYMWQTHGCLSCLCMGLDVDWHGTNGNLILYSHSSKPCCIAQQVARVRPKAWETSSVWVSFHV